MGRLALRDSKLTLGDLGGAVGRVNEDIATLGTESGGDGLSKSVNTLEETGTSLNTELELLFVVSTNVPMLIRDPRQAMPVIGIGDSVANSPSHVPCEQNAAAGGSESSG